MLSFEQITAAYPTNIQTFGKSMLREYLQYKILEAVFNSKYSSKLVFIGGTALRIIYENSRFSEDIDFDNFGLTEAEFKELSKEIKKKLELEGYKVEIRQIYKQAFHCYVRFPDILYENKLSPHKQEKILVQMDTLSQGFDYQSERKMLNKFDVFTHIKSAPLDLLLSQKLLAALERKRAKGRDFYDVVFLLSKIRPNYNYLKQKLNIANAQSLKKTMIKRYKGLDFKQLANDVRPFLFFEKDTKKIEQFKEFWEQASL